VIGLSLHLQYSLQMGRQGCLRTGLPFWRNSEYLDSYEFGKN